MHSLCSHLVVVIVVLTSQAYAHAQASAIPPSTPSSVQPGVVPPTPAVPSLQLRVPDYRAAKLELQQLRSQRPSLVGPITTTAVGGAIAYGALSATSSIEAYRFFSGTDSISKRPLRDLYITAGAASVVACAGLVWMIVTLRERRKIKYRIQELLLSLPVNAPLRW